MFAVPSVELPELPFACDIGAQGDLGLGEARFPATPASLAPPRSFPLSLLLGGDSNGTDNDAWGLADRAAARRRTWFRVRVTVSDVEISAITSTGLRPSSSLQRRTKGTMPNSRGITGGQMTTAWGGGERRVSLQLWTQKNSIDKDEYCARS